MRRSAAGPAQALGARGTGGTRGAKAVLDALTLDGRLAGAQRP